jgi:prepilin-type N-terminal cleavage/methylation domain-containing protein/prepilin-type processing-associated H-X9-DG protein
MKFHRRRGFTLIELLTVIAILGLLMAILFPSLSRARATAKAGMCLTRLKGLSLGTTIYLNENNNTFYPARLDRLRPTDRDFYVNRFGRERPRWQWFIETDFGPPINPGPFQQMNAIPFGDETQARADPLKMNVEVFSCPELVDPLFEFNIRDGAYGYNYQYLGNARNEANRNLWDNFPVALHLIKSPAQTVMLADSRGAGPKHGKNSYLLDPPRLAIERNAKRFGPERQDAALDVHRYSPVEARHSGFGNVVFADGHGESMSLKELGYEVSDGSDKYPDLLRGSPFPIFEPESGSYEATNRLWTGTGIDKIALEANPIPPGGD